MSVTDQLRDGVRYSGAGFDLLGAEPGVFSPHEQGIEPYMVCTSNGCGWLAGYEVQDGRLYLQNLLVGQRQRFRRASSDPELDALLGVGDGTPAPLPVLNGVTPRPFAEGYLRYEGIGMRLDYSGRLTLGHAGPDETCQPVFELEFSEGVLQAARPVEAP